MIDPCDLTKPWDQQRIEEWFLFGVCVAGKGATQTAAKLERFLGDVIHVLSSDVPPRHLFYYGTAPFQYVRALIQHKMLGRALRKHKMGQYRRLGKAFRGIVNVNPWHCSLAELEAIHGVGPKTARMLLLYTRPGLEVIPLDTHILKWLRANGYKAPKTTPVAGPKYRELEAAFITEGKKRGLTPKEWDTQVWKTYAKGMK